MTKYLVPIYKKWVDLIVSGEKKYEFRGNTWKNVKQGDTIFIYETFGKRIRLKNNISYCSCVEQCDCEYPNRTYANYKHEGLGKVRASFVVGEVIPLRIAPCEDNRWEEEIIDNDWDWFHHTFEEYYDINDFYKQGYNKEKHTMAFEITNLVVFDEKECSKINGVHEDNYFDICKKCNYDDFDGVSELCYKPTTPKELNEFISVKKLEETRKDNNKICFGCDNLRGFNSDYCMISGNKGIIKNCSKVRVNNAPQSLMRVLEVGE